MKFSLLFIGFVFVINAQPNNYKKDSLQIKVYSTIEYIDYTPKKIEIVKVFCEYCNEAQTQFIKRQAWDETYRLRKAEKYRIKVGSSKLAIYIRVAKKKFRSLNKDEQR